MKLALWLSVLSVFPVCAEEAADTAPAKHKLQVQGTLRTRLENWEWFTTPGGNDTYSYLGSYARFQFSQQFNRVDWVIEMNVPFLLGMPDNSQLAAPFSFLGVGGNYWSANKRETNAAMIFPRQANLRFKDIAGIKGQSLKIGRFDFADGSETTPKNAALAALKTARINMRMLGNFGWTHVGRSFDGFHYSLAKPGGTLTAIAAIPTRGVFQVDGWGQTKTAFTYLSYAMPTGVEKSAGELRVFNLYYHDWRHIPKTDNRPAAARNADLANIGIFTWGGHYIHALQTTAGTADLLLWGALQHGRWGRLEHRGGAGIVEAGFQPKVLPKLKPWIRGGYSHSTGDNSPNDTRHGTFFQVLPTPRPFARLPFFNMMNNDDAYGILILRPHKALTINSEMHSMRLSNSNDQWLLGGGAFQPWTFGYVGRPSNGAKGLATLWDVSADYRINPKWTLSGYFGNVTGKSVVSAIYPKGNTAKLGYIELSVRLF